MFCVKTFTKKEYWRTVSCFLARAQPCLKTKRLLSATALPSYCSLNLKRVCTNRADANLLCVSICSLFFLLIVWGFCFQLIKLKASNMGISHHHLTMRNWIVCIQNEILPYCMLGLGILFTACCFYNSQCKNKVCDVVVNLINCVTSSSGIKNVI